MIINESKLKKKYRNKLKSQLKAAENPVMLNYLLIVAMISLEHRRRLKEFSMVILQQLYPVHLQKRGHL